MGYNGIRLRRGRSAELENIWEVGNKGGISEGFRGFSKWCFECNLKN